MPDEAGLVPVGKATPVRGAPLMTGVYPVGLGNVAFVKGVMA